MLNVTDELIYSHRYSSDHVLMFYKRSDGSRYVHYKVESEEHYYNLEVNPKNPDEWVITKEVWNQNV